MPLVDAGRLDPLERRCPESFLLAGCLFVVFAVLWGVGNYTDVAPRPAVDIFGPAGWAASFVGLLGLYPGLVDRMPRTALAGAAMVVVGAVGAVVTVVANLTLLAGVLTDLPGWTAAFNLPIFVGIIPGFLTFAAASLRAGTRSRTVGLLLAVPALLFTVNVARVLLLGPTTPPWAPFALGIGQALALGGIGYSIRTASDPTDSPSVSPDSTT